MAKSNTRLGAVPSCMTPTANYDVIVIGAGSGGIAAVSAASSMKQKTLLIEKHKVGGDCTWLGCVPSKAIIHAAREVHAGRLAGQFGVTPVSGDADMKKVMGYVQRKVQEVYSEETPEKLTEKYGCEVMFGEAKFCSNTIIQVGNTTVYGRYIIVCVGGKALEPKITGIEHVPYLTYESLWEMETLPKHVMVVGAGPIGMELGQSLRRLGSDVTVVANRILPHHVPEAGKIIESVFRKEGVRFQRGRAVGVRKEGGKIIVTAGTKDGQNTDVTGSHLLVSAGRAPALSGLNLEKAGVKLNKNGGICVDKFLRTSAKNIYAAGDCLGSEQFTHYAAFQAFQGVMNALLPIGRQPGITDAVPAATFTDPEVAECGLTLEKARHKHGMCVVSVNKWSMQHVDRAVCDDVQEEGFIQVVYNKKNARIYGCTVMGPRAGEMISEIAAVIQLKGKLIDVARSIHPYPTYSFAFMQLFAELEMKRVFASSTGKFAIKLANLKKNKMFKLFC